MEKEITPKKFNIQRNDFLFNNCPPEIWCFTEEKFFNASRRWQDHVSTQTYNNCMRLQGQDFNKLFYGPYYSGLGLKKYSGSFMFPSNENEYADFINQKMEEKKQILLNKKPTNANNEQITPSVALNDAVKDEILSQQEKIKSEIDKSLQTINNNQSILNKSMESIKKNNELIQINFKDQTNKFNEIERKVDNVIKIMSALTPIIGKISESQTKIREQVTNLQDDIDLIRSNINEMYNNNNDKMDINEINNNVKETIYSILKRKKEDKPEIKLEEIKPVPNETIEIKDVFKTKQTPIVKVDSTGFFVAEKHKLDSTSFNILPEPQKIIKLLPSGFTAVPLETKTN